MKGRLILSGLLISLFLIVDSVCAQGNAIDYKQLMAKCGEAIKQAKSYNIIMELKNSFTINAKENKRNSAELHIAFRGPDRFKVEQVIDEGSDENLWDGWLLIGDDYYVFSPAFGWTKRDDDNRIAICKTYSPEGIIKQFEDTEKEYKKNSISSAVKDGVEYFVIEYSFGKESINAESLPPELREGKISGTCKIWIDKNSYLPLMQSEEVSYYSNEQNQGTSSTTTQYFAYNNDETKIDEPVPGDKVF